MSAGMADIIGMHNGFDTHWEARDRTQVWYVVCNGCHWRHDVAGRDAPAETYAAHLAEELTKAGYGNVQEAKAAALREAAKDLAKIAYVVPGAAGREEYESRLAVRRGDTDKWLNSRADMIDALNDPEGHALVQAIHDRKGGQ